MGLMPYQHNLAGRKVWKMLVVVSRGAVLPFRVVLKLRHYVETRGNFTVHKLFRRKRATGTCLSSHIVSSSSRWAFTANYFRTIYARDDEITFAEAIVLSRVTISYIELVSIFSGMMRIPCRFVVEN